MTATTPRQVELELTAGSDAPLCARTAIRSNLGAQLPAARLTALLTVLTELVANSVKHGGGGPIRVRVDVRKDRAVTGRVADGGKGLVAIRESATLASGGMGLKLVDALTDRWGVEAGTTDVWFELGAASAAAGA